MILFFHFICFIARYIVLNISKTFTNTKSLSDEDTSRICSPENFEKKIEYPKQPTYDSGFLRFFPPVYVQRYETVAFTLQDSELGFEIRKIVDFGCAELGFFVYLKSIESVTEILEVDIDSNLLERYAFKAAPLTSDYLMGKRSKPLDVYILAGNVADYDDYLLNCDAVVAIELIEHLSKEDFEKMPYNIFYKIRPKIAIFTTPNADFNSLLPNISSMRHKDHKFEWSRKEFYKWTQEILERYPEYNVRFFGIGAGPEGTENLGCCSQMAVFKRLEDDTETFTISKAEYKRVQNYELIKHYEFPAYLDERTTEEKIIHEVQYHAAYLRGLDVYYNYETNKSEIPLSLIKEYVSDFQCNDGELMKILSNSGMTLKNKNNSWFLIFSDTDSNSSDCNVSENWLSEDSPVNDIYDQRFEEKWSDEEQVKSEKLKSFQSISTIKFSKKYSLNMPDVKEEDCNCVSAKNHRNSNSLFNNDDSLHKLSGLNIENQEMNQSSTTKNKVSYKMSGAETKFMPARRKSIFHVRNPCKKISRSSSLDSFLENIDFETPKNESYISSIAGSSSPFHNMSQISYLKRKYGLNYSDTSLLSISNDKAGDSGYPFSYSPHSEDLTPEQVDDLFTDNEISNSASLSSEIDNVDVFNQVLHHDEFAKKIDAEHGNFANNNPEREGNNAGGLLGQRIPNRIAAERNRNDNYFFPDIEDFPPWLLNIGALALQPVYIPLYESDNYESVMDGDVDSSTDFNQNLDLEDLDVDF